MTEADSLRFAICVNNAEYPVSLELHKIYRVLPEPEEDRYSILRIIDESGEDYLFPAEYFVLIEVPGAAGRVLSESFADTV